MKHHKHLVVVMFENRSFDNMCGYMENPHLNNIVNHGALGNFDGKRFIPCSKGKETSLKYDPGEDYPHVLVQLGTPESFNGGTIYPMDGFAKDYASHIRHRLHAADHVKDVMCSIDPSRIPVFTSLAESFLLCDNWFCDAPTQTYANRSYFHAGTSGGQFSNTPYSHWIHSTSRTVFDQLEEKKLSYKIYFDSRDVFSLTYLIHYQSLSQKPHSTRFAHHHHLFDDLRLGTLPLYSFVEPRFLVAPSDYHPPDADSIPFHNSVQSGERFLQEIYQAWKTSPIRDETLLVITFDEHGGLYDHVSPPPLLGLRVPTLLISTHIDQKHLSRHVCSTLLQHTSILRTLHDWLGLAPLTSRDATAAALPDELFTADVTIDQKSLPIVTPFLESSDPAGLMTADVRLRGLAQTMVEHVFTVFKQWWPSRASNQPVADVCRRLRHLRTRHGVFDHLPPETQDKNSCLIL
jgi:phospholipase C